MGQLTKHFKISHDGNTHAYMIENVDAFPAEKRLEINVLGLHCETDEQTTAFTNHFKGYLGDIDLDILYTQIEEVSYDNIHCFKSSIENIFGDDADIVNSSFSLNEDEILIVYPDEIDAEKRKNFSELIKENTACIKNPIRIADPKPKKKSGAKKSSSTSKTRGKISYIYANDKKFPYSEIADVDGNSGRVTIKGYVTGINIKEMKDGQSHVFEMDITDYNSTITCSRFLAGKMKNKQKTFEAFCTVKKGMLLQVQGDSVYNKYLSENIINIASIAQLQDKPKTDDEAQKRIELHLHTKLSTLDSVVDIKELLSTVETYGHEAIGITDHGCVQSFPDVADMARKMDVKVLYGVEAYLFDDTVPAVFGHTDMKLNGDYVVFDVETTGLLDSKDVMIEIAGVKVSKGMIVDEYSSFINPHRKLPDKIIELTKITDAMVENAPEEEKIIPEFVEFAKGCVLVAHNSRFDMGFLNKAMKRHGINEEFTSVDTIQVAKRVEPERRVFNLGAMVKAYKIELKSHHRAVDDAKATAYLMMQLLDKAEAMGIEKIEDLNKVKNMNIQGRDVFHAVIYAQNQVGLKNLYKLVSIANLDYMFRGKPNMPKSKLMELREGLIVGSACEAGELYRAIVDEKDDDVLEKIASFYDYLEVQPLGNNQFMIASKKIENVTSIDDLVRFNKKVIDIGKKLDKLVVATGDVHFLKQNDKVFRAILMDGQGFDDANDQPPLYYRTTKEMLNEFSYLDEETARDLVIHNPKKIADMMEEIEPLPPLKLYAPKKETSNDDIIRISEESAHRIYGEALPEIVQKRMDKELHSITTYDYALLYLVAQELVFKSNADGYIVGSRGSVGSSFIAALMGITEVNPLSPHYVCKKCNYSDFDVDSIKYGCGPDLPDKNCPECGEKMTKLGFNIPFEVFLGFKGDKVPDIDLNFSGENQGDIQKHTEVMFGKEYVYKAGTVSSVKSKTAYGYVMKYLEKFGISASRAEINRLVDGCVGVRRTTGQHPGGIVVIPHEYDVYDFTPIQYPADSKEKGVITTHFTFNQMHDRLVKLDILGHDDPTMIKRLKQATGVQPEDIPLDDEKVLSLFSSTKALGLTEEEAMAPVGSYGLPEFGTPFVRGMLVDTAPSTVAELIRISGLSHGTDVWLGNAQDLIKSKTATLMEAICTRDDIMEALINKGVEAKIAFKTMESVRKGRGLTEEMESAMHENNVEQWFIDSCKKIKYMFPKAHAAAYVIMALRVAYYKVYHPLEYYSTYFTVRGSEDFDYVTMVTDYQTIRSKVKEYRAKNDATVKDKGTLTVLELVMEMMARGYEFQEIDIYKAEATRFTVTDGKIMPPFIAVPQLGASAAQSVVDARKNGKFNTISELRERTSLNNTVIDLMKEIGILKDMPERAQMSIFDF